MSLVATTPTTIDHTMLPNENTSAARCASPSCG
eukprot:CAMPEP_0198360262 /NCGR_PEP_ID=MMETSP1450-20131203/137698_1 /TAXON_ID=753684 ORGANISM="Madagascaria erythrocladiodes, Strain CCMP3234" /NCGR_SAMPLE_ID=MMETSP1450 /ASSEMBLY_ACC=CAM_ASM_001115 /LENGTH=32 /DNA_ID= /DNA_START= /DNA_END= /DNA_ORIENTATION=